MIELYKRNKNRIELLEKEIPRLKETIKDMERRVELIEKREMQRQLNGVDFSQKW